QIIPGYSFFWIFMLKDYLDYSTDIDFVKQYIPVIDKIVTHFESVSSPEGLITKSRYWDFTDWVSEWDNGEPVVEEGRVITVYNMYFAYALLCAEDICKKSGRNGLASEYKVKYNKLADSIKKYCFNSDKKLYTDSLGDNNYSVHTIIWAIISEISTGDEALSLISHLDDEKISKTSFSMNYYLFRALEKCGRTDLIFKNMDGWVTMLNNHCTSWCEHPGKTSRSECHGWSSAPLHEFSSNILGVKTSFEDEIVIMPYTANLSFAKGTVPTRFGYVYVSWKKENGVFKITVEAPSGARKKLIMPDGKILLFESCQTTMEYTNKEVVC
ncbi:MAG: hypothetical protein IKJ59_16115, partial [Clostridia bacterium]|nr:hypothetical protein [Clostridia bacterium]